MIMSMIEQIRSRDESSEREREREIERERENARSMLQEFELRLYVVVSTVN